MPILISPRLGEACRSPLSPEPTTSSAFPDAGALQAAGCFSSLVFHDGRCPDFCIRLSNYFISADPGWSKGRGTGPLLALQFVLQGDLHYRLGSHPHSHFHSPGSSGKYSVVKIMEEGQYNMVTLPSMRTISWFNTANSHTTTLDIYFSPAALRKPGIEFPELAGLLEKREQSVPGLLSSCPGSVNPELLRILHAILDCNYVGDLRRVYMQSKVSELLFIALERIISHSKEKAPGISLKRYDVEKIQESREWLLLNMETPPTLKELAHHAGINDFKLKKGFKQLFGIPIFEYFKQARMEKASQLLQETDKPHVEIAMLTGYKSTSGFAAAFKDFSGFTPGDFRKMFEKNS